MLNFLRNLTEPEIVDAEPKRSENPALTALGLAVVAEIIAGPDNTFLDKAAFVATPYIIAAAAELAVNNSKNGTATLGTDSQEK